MDRELIRMIREGNRGAFDRFCRSRYVSLISYARLFVPAVWAEDVVQDVLFGVWQHRSSLRDDPSRVQSYMVRSVYNRCMNYRKRERLRGNGDATLDERILELVAPFYSPDRNPVMANLFNDDLHRIIEAAVNRLSPRCREVFRMSYLEDIPDKEIAARLGLSLRTVENHVYSALKQLRADLSGTMAE